MVPSTKVASYILALILCSNITFFSIAICYGILLVTYLNVSTVGSKTKTVRQCTRGNVVIFLQTIHNLTINLNRGNAINNQLH